MIMKTATSFAFAAACVLTVSALPAHAQYASPTVVTNGPQTDPGDVSPSWSARQNVIESQRYERLLHTSPGFRQARMRKSAGHNRSAIACRLSASFNQGEPNVGSSTPPPSYSSESGRRPSREAEAADASGLRPAPLKGSQHFNSCRRGDDDNRGTPDE
jgi:hypothetical protein